MNIAVMQHFGVVSIVRDHKGVFTFERVYEVDAGGDYAVLHKFRKYRKPSTASAKRVERQIAALTASGLAVRTWFDGDGYEVLPS